MPTYEYECESGHRYEKREGFEAPSKQKCPTCKKMARRVIHAPPIVFKGSGFYATDSRGSTASESSSASDSSEGKGESGDGAAKPAAADDGHGHTHGPGGHTHDTPAPKKDAEATAAT